MRLFGTRLLRSLLVILSLSFATSAWAASSSISLLLGPGMLGNGGSNPIGLPPGATDLEVTYVTSADHEINVSLVPGLLGGHRFRDQNIFVSLGGGLLFSATGLGLGVYSAFGLISGSGNGLHFTAEYTQTFGITANGWTAPGALRLGALWAF